MLPFFALDPKKTAREARKLRDEGKWEKGYSLCKKALKTSPKDPDLLEIACELALLLKKYREAIGHFALLRNYPDRKKKLIDNLIEHFGGEEEDKILLREHVLIELVSEGDIERIESIYNLIPEKEKEHFVKKHGEKDDFVSGMLVYSIYFYSRKYMEAVLKLYELWKKFRDKREIIKKEIARIQNMGFIRKYAGFFNFISNYYEGKEEEATLYVEDIIDDESFYLYIIEQFEKRKPELPYFKLLYSHLIIIQGDKKRGLELLKEAISDKEGIDLNYAYEIAKSLKSENLSENEIRELAEIFTQLGKTEEAAEILKERMRDEVSVKSLRESLLKSFSPRAFRIFLEMEEESLDEDLEYMYSGNPDYLNDRDVLDILKDIAEERKFKSPFFLFSLASSSIRNGEFKNGILIFRYLLKLNFNIDLIEKEISRKREDLVKIPEGFMLELEILLNKKDEKFFEKMSEFIDKFPSYNEYALLLLDEAGIKNNEWNDKIIDFIQKNKNKFTEKYLLALGLAYIRKGEFKEGTLCLYEGYKKKINFVKKLTENIMNYDVPEVHFLKGLLELESENFKDAKEFLRKGLKDKRLLRELLKVLSEKLKRKKSKEILFLFVEALLLGGKYDEALRFLNNLKEGESEKMLADISAMESAILWKKGDKEKAKEIIKNLLREKNRFDPSFLYEFLKEEEKNDKSPFIYQTLGSIALLLSKPKEAARYYFILSLKAKKLIPKIKDIFITIESRFPYFPEIEVYKKGLEIIEGKADLNEVITLYEENPDIKDEFAEFLNLLPLTRQNPHLLFLLSKLNYETGRDFKEEIKKSYELANKERLYELLNKIRNFAYERIKNGEDGIDLLLFILRNESREWKRFFNLLIEKSFLKKNRKEIFDTFRVLFLKGIRDKDFVFTYADELSKDNDKTCIYIYQEALDKYPEEIEKRKNKWEKFIPEGLGLGLNVSMKLKDLEKFKERVKKIIKHGLLGTFYATIREGLKVFGYDEELYNILRKCAYDVRDTDTEIHILKELAKRERKFEYFKKLIEKIVLFRRDEVNVYWEEFVKMGIMMGRFDEVQKLWQENFSFERKTDIYRGDYLGTFFVLDPLKLGKFLKGKRNFPLPLKEP